jgi:hypothetical protein
MTNIETIGECMSLARRFARLNKMKDAAYWAKEALNVHYDTRYPYFVMSTGTHRFAVHLAGE